MSDKDGGPAFPLPCLATTNYSDWPTSGGDSLWDYFAAASIAGFNANPDLTEATSAQVAGYAADQADAMLAERKKRGIGQ